ncbi:glycosyl hydrolase family 8 [Geodermatophilus sp. DSM 44513]|uniref:glycosyl hydrolase family 8 n=1 Tax=Geodermatophilus sp. DSM 44513 TaxID=1528104 RepID=UPI001412A573|nr:glycosyl hydrolase family 8 [Geodermatophilus sp. DSM 44513]WNV75874.1 glycosyl hydrolase family 8 [Geodermatophilus sp. DSM 44513]
MATVTVIALLAVLAVALSTVRGRGDTDAAPAPTTGVVPVPAQELRPYTAVEAGRAFLGGYVSEDGRVVRTDQGGDTVSEGQAYAMLVAVGLDDADAFARSWSWTRDNLQRPDGLLSWRWADGRVADESSASDADLDAARALVLAGERFDRSDYTDAGLALGRAVLDLETVQTPAGRILVAGQWATTLPHAYNPSYASPAATAVLAAASGDPRWAELDQGSRAVTAALLAAAPLPPDWAQVRRDGTVEAMPGAQGRGQSVRYGYDAARTAIRFAESCDAADRALAAAMAGPLDRGGDVAELDLGGSPLTEGESVVAAVAQAAAVAAAGDADRAARELVDADHLAQSVPSYYGAAWAALGRLVLTDDVLGGCPPAPVAP